MTRLKYVIGAGVAMALALSSASALAQNAPFIIIRFNQQRMYYEQPLYNAVAKAVGIKSDVMFDVVGVAPRTGDPSADRAWQERSRANVQQVVNTLNSIGVPSSRLSVSYTQAESAQQKGPRFDEVRISAR